MVDFGSNARFTKLKEVEKDKFLPMISPYLVEGEQIICCYQAIRDFLIFTTKRMIFVDVQGITGTKKDFSSLPYKNIQAFSVKTAGVLDMDSDVDLFFAGLGRMHLEFARAANLGQICKLISHYALG